MVPVIQPLGRAFLGFLEATGRICMFTGTAVSHNPAKHATVAASCCAVSFNFCCASRQAAQPRLVSAISMQNGF